MRQLRFFKPQSLEYGGTLSLNKRKTQRVLALKKPLHLVLKSKSSSLFKHKSTLIRILHQQARAQGIKVYSHSIQNDHWHLVVRITSRSTYRAFIRALTGLIARKLGKGLWKLLPYTRILQWGRDFNNTLAYVFQNQMEVLGVWKYAPRAQHRRWDLKDVCVPGTERGLWI